MQYRIWNIKLGMWWRNGARNADGSIDCFGYSEHIQAAGKYNAQDAVRICQDANTVYEDGKVAIRNGPPNEAMVPITETAASV